MLKKEHADVGAVNSREQELGGRKDRSVILSREWIGRTLEGDNYR